MANYMSEVAKMLGVELGEEFYIKEMQDIKCVMYKDGLHTLPLHDCICTLPHGSSTLTNLLAGNVSIKRIPWKPHTNETYHFVDEEGVVCEDVWLDCSDDILLYKCGNCYKTHAEAAQYGNKWYEFFKSDKMLEV